jgi:hypothetical protein
MIDAELSQLAFCLDLMQVIDIWVTHNQVELTKDAKDPLKPKVRFEGNPHNPWDFHNPAIQQQRYKDCDTVSAHMKSIGADTTWWANVKSGKQYPWARLQELDVNNQMKQFDMTVDSNGKILQVTPEKSHVK